MKREADEGRTRCHELQHWDQGKLKMEPAQSPQAKEREAKLVPDATNEPRHQLQRWDQLGREGTQWQ